MTRLIEVDEIKKREHDVTLGNGAKHRCFDTTCLDEIPTVEAIPVDWIIEWEKREENYYLYKHMVRFMIDDWRKENK